MGCAVSADKTGTVQRKCHIQILQGNVVDQLVISPLQESRIDGYNRFQAFTGEAGRESDGMLFGYTDVKKALGVIFCKLDHSRAFFHGRG